MIYHFNLNGFTIHMNFQINPNIDDYAQKKKKNIITTTTEEYIIYYKSNKRNDLNHL